MIDRSVLRGQATSLIVAMVLVVSVGSSGAVAGGGGTSAVQGEQTASCGEDELRVEGKAVFRYEPTEYDPGYNGSYHPYRKAVVEVVEVTDTENETLRSVETDLQGRFDACISRTSDQTERDIFIRFVAHNPAGKWLNATRILNGQIVTDPSRTYSINTSQQAVTVGTPLAELDRKAVFPVRNNTGYHLVNSALEARRYLKTQTTENWTRGDVRLLFPTPATSYTSGTQYIGVVNDKYSRDQGSLWHEYGHAVMYTVYDRGGKVTPRGGGDGRPDLDCHSFATESWPTFALTEGWATWFSQSVGGNYDDEVVYYDTELALCPPSDADGTMDGYRVEGSVVQILHDLRDGGPNDDDGIDGSFELVFEIFQDHYPRTIWDVYEAAQDDVEDQAALDSIFTTHGVDVVAPEVTVDGGTTQAVWTNNVTLSGRAVDEHSNVSRVEIRLRGGSWETVVTGAVETWSTNVSVDGKQRNLTVRASDPWGNNETVTVTLRPGGEPPIVGDYDNPVQDLDGDGLYEDIDGDGNVTVFDAVGYFNNRDAAAVQQYPSLFDFDRNGEVGTVFDAIALYNSAAG